MTEEIPTEALTSFARSLNDLRGSLKWLVAAAGAVVAVVVAGLSLNEAGGADGWYLVIAVLGAAVAIAVTLGFLWQAGRILTLPRPTIVDLSNTESRVMLGSIKEDAVVLWLQNRRTYLLRGNPTITGLYMDEYLKARKALTAFDQRAPFKWRGREYGVEVAETDSEGALRNAMVEEVRTLEGAIAVVEDAAHLADTELQYRKMLKRIPSLGAVFIAAVLMFVIATSLAAYSSAKGSASIEEPIAVRVFITDPSALGMPATCNATEMNGVAVAGTLEDPTVVLEPEADCPSRTVRPGEGIVILPVPS